MRIITASPTLQVFGICFFLWVNTDWICSFNQGGFLCCEFGLTFKEVPVNVVLSFILCYADNFVINHLLTYLVLVQKICLGLGLGLWLWSALLERSAFLYMWLYTMYSSDHGTASQFHLGLIDFIVHRFRPIRVWSRYRLSSELIFFVEKL